MDSAKRQEFGNRLKCELDKAQTEYSFATQTFDRIVKEVPTRVPQPDGDLRIRQAGTATRLALEQYIVALRRFTDFTLRGTVPEDFHSDA